MRDKNIENEELEIDLKRVFSALLSKWWLIAIVSLICTSGALLYTRFLVTPLYQSSAMFYVNNNSLSIGDTSVSISQGDISASKSLVDSYIVILKTRSTLNDVIDYAGVDLSYSEMKEIVSAGSVNGTEIFEVTVTHPSAETADKIADAIAYVLPRKISNIIEGTSAEIVDSAVIASKPSSPNYFTNLAVGFILGMALSVMYIVLKEILDVTIRSEEDIEQCCEHPILAIIPNIYATSNESAYKPTSKGSKKTKKEDVLAASKSIFVSDNINFAAKEAYKLLRTKIQFSFADENKCYVIGISSALAGEGKSTTSCHLACDLAQLNKRVLIVDCDMRKPTLHSKLSLNKTPGLSNYLTRQVNLNDILQQYMDKYMMHPFDVVSAGENPPNPVELLSSRRMEKAMEELKKEYDYILFDLPPIGEVSDSLVASKLCDGIVLVARQDYCSRIALAAAVNQFEFVDSRILGVVFNYVSESSAYKYSYKYGYKYGYRYGKYYKEYRED